MWTQPSLKHQHQPIAEEDGVHSWAYFVASIVSGTKIKRCLIIQEERDSVLPVLHIHLVTVGTLQGGWGHRLRAEQLEEQERAGGKRRRGRILIRKRDTGSATRLQAVEWQKQPVLDPAASSRVPHGE